MATADNDRTIRINVRLASHIKDRLENYSSHIGMAASTVAAFAISEYLDTKERQANLNKDMASSMAPRIMEIMANMTQTPEGLKQLEMLTNAIEASDEAD